LDEVVDSKKDPNEILSNSKNSKNNPEESTQKEENEISNIKNPKNNSLKSPMNGIFDTNSNPILINSKTKKLISFYHLQMN
jgi:hypothetical protein